MTNLNKSREEIIYELLLSINQGDGYYTLADGEATPRIDLAIGQYEALVRRGVIKER